MPLLYFTEPAHTMAESWFAPRSSLDMDNFFPQALARQQTMRAQARSQARAERARRQRLEAQRREAIAARIMAIEAARRQAMHEEYERRQRKALAIRRQQERQRREQLCIRAFHLEKQRQRANQETLARHRFDLDDWPFGSHFLPSGLEHILDNLFDHQEPEPELEFQLTLEVPQEDDQEEGPSQRQIEPKPAQEPAPTKTSPNEELVQEPTEKEQSVSEPSPVESLAEAQVEPEAEPQDTPAETETERQTLLFHPFTPALKRNSAAADASKIQVDVKDNRVTVSGLWSLEDPSNRRSVSPRSKARATHVRDVDENGEEILLPRDTDESDSDASDNDVPAVSKTIDLPPGVTADQLHADLNDQGFTIWIF